MLGQKSRNGDKRGLRVGEGKGMGLIKMFYTHTRNSKNKNVLMQHYAL